MKCSVCPKTIPAARLRANPQAKTCSDTCAVKRHGEQANLRAKTYRQRVRKALEEIKHIPLFPDQDAEIKVRKGHVVGLQQADGSWQLAIVVRATHEGRSTHAISACSREPQRARSGTRLSSETVVVLPPELAKDHAVKLLSEFADVHFAHLEDLRQRLVASVES